LGGGWKVLDGSNWLTFLSYGDCVARGRGLRISFRRTSRESTICYGLGLGVGERRVRLIRIRCDVLLFWFMYGYIDGDVISPGENSEFLDCCHTACHIFIRIRGLLDI
jgi:hypothetical protein